MKVEAEFNAQDYGLICKVNEVTPLYEALARLYQQIWIEACYDAYNAETRALCRRLLADIQVCNAILQFKK